MQTDRQTDRQSNYELMRIVSMLMIIGYHLSVHGVMYKYSNTFNNGIDKLVVWRKGSFTNQCITSFLQPGGEVGVAIFFMLAGYFLIDRKKGVNLQKLVCQGLFYGVIACLIVASAFFLGVRPGLTKAIFILEACIESIISPYSNWWFLGTYILVVLLLPAIQSVFLKYDRNGQIKLLCLIWLFIYCINLLLNSGYANLMKGIFFFILGGYIRINFSQNKVNNRIYLWLMFAIFFWMIDSMVLYETNVLSLLNGTKVKLIVNVFGIIDYGLLVPSCATFLFLFFSTLHIQCHTINRIASTTFGIYLLHDNIAIRELLWSKLLKVDTVQYTSSLFPLYAIVDVIVIFLIGMCVDLFRQKYIAPLIEKKWNSIKSSFQKYKFSN